MAALRAIVDRWAAAYNARDAISQAALYAENASNWQHALGAAVIGRERIQAGLAAFYLAFPDSSITSESLLEVGNQVAWFWLARGTWTGPFIGQMPSGRAYSLHGSTLFEIRDGRIVSQRAYWDRASWFKQIGIPV